MITARRLDLFGGYHNTQELLCDLLFLDAIYFFLLDNSRMHTGTCVGAIFSITT